MVNEKEFNIIKALIEEETENLRKIDCLDSSLLTDYLFTLSDIVEKLEKDIEPKRDFLYNLP